MLIATDPLAPREMATVSSTGSSAVQYGYGQLRLQQARRAAEQAEQDARSLQSQAASARRSADRAEENARTLEVSSSEARSNAVRARQGLAAVQSASQMGAQIAAVADRTVAQQNAKSTASTTTSNTGVVNSQGQVIGKIVDTTA